MSLKPESHTSDAQHQQQRADVLAEVAKLGATYQVLEVLAKLSDQELADMCFFFAVVAQRAATEAVSKS